MRNKRIMVKLSLPMEVALQVLSERQGLPPAAIAFMRLREGLQRTMDTEAVQERVKSIKTSLSYSDWSHDSEMEAAQLALEGIQDEDAGPRADTGEATARERDLRGAG